MTQPGVDRQKETPSRTKRSRIAAGQWCLGSGLKESCLCQGRARCPRGSSPWRFQGRYQGQDARAVALGAVWSQQTYISKDPLQARPGVGVGARCRVDLLYLSPNISPPSTHKPCPSPAHLEWSGPCSVTAPPTSCGPAHLPNPALGSFHQASSRRRCFPLCKALPRLHPKLPLRGPL